MRAFCQFAGGKSPRSPYRRAEKIGITGVMCSPWADRDDIHAGAHDARKQPAERYRAPIERFAADVVAKCR